MNDVKDIGTATQIFVVRTQTGDYISSIPEADAAEFVSKAASDAKVGIATNQIINSYEAVLEGIKNNLDAALAEMRDAKVLTTGLPLAEHAKAATLTIHELIGTFERRSEHLIQIGIASTSQYISWFIKHAASELPAGPEADRLLVLADECTKNINQMAFNTFTFAVEQASKNTLKMALGEAAKIKLMCDLSPSSQLSGEQSEGSMVAGQIMEAIAKLIKTEEAKL